MRYRLHGNYLIFYRVDENEVFVAHILHAAMDYAPILSSR
jgi:plasmid stabilization system protein ParE